MWGLVALCNNCSLKNINEEDKKNPNIELNTTMEWYTKNTNDWYYLTDY
jgi:hypothetical protein